MLTTVKFVIDLFFMNDFVIKASDSYEKNYDFVLRNMFRKFRPWFLSIPGSRRPEVIEHGQRVHVHAEGRWCPGPLARKRN
jgi:hypothetical protein